MPEEKSITKTSHDVNKSAGEESVIIRNADVMPRTSIISSMLDWSDASPQLKEEEISEGITYEKEYFKKVMERELDENKYIIQKKLRAGGMGEVYYIYDRDFHRFSAMKVILPELKHDSRVIDSFITEAQVTAQMEHPNIIPVHDLGFLPGKGIFFTMKLMKGEPLNHVLQKIEIGDREYIRKFDIFMLLGIFRKVCDAVAFAHSKKILHRDIKPHNIMAGDYGEVLLMDWGLSKRIGASERLPKTPEKHSKKPKKESESKEASHVWDATEIGVVKGSPAFMSPEQALGDVTNLDERSDIFLLGATLYHIFTFYPPYLGDDVFDIVCQARSHDLIPPEELGTGRMEIPADLSKIIMKALSKNKEDRYSRVEEMTDDIDAFLRGEIDFRHKIFKKGEVLMREGELGSQSYIIVTGKVRVDKNIKGKPVEVSVLKEGDIVGEMSIITSEPRSATVTALERTEVLVLDQDLFKEYLGKSPPWLSKTFISLAERLNVATSKHASGK